MTAPPPSPLQNSACHARVGYFLCCQNDYPRVLVQRPHKLVKWSALTSIEYGSQQQLTDDPSIWLLSWWSREAGTEQMIWMLCHTNPIPSNYSLNYKRGISKAEGHKKVPAQQRSQLEDQTRDHSSQHHKHCWEFETAIGGQHGKGHQILPNVTL